MAVVIPFPRVDGPLPVRRERRMFTCPVCSVVDPTDVGWHCVRCRCAMHEACYWGRVATLDEWREYNRLLSEGPEDYCPDVLCAACRAGESA